LVKIGAAAGVIGTAAVAGFAILAKSSLSATADYEKLTLQLETLTARELKNADSTLTMGVALELAGDKTQELLKWTQELAIESPFDQETVANALQQAMNYGFTSEQAKALTENLIDMGAGMGWTADKMGLVSYAMGQINQSGTLMTQDLRQLMSAGVPVIDILETMGYTLEDVGTEAISSADFLAEFNKMVDEDFTGSAERMTKSWGGMISTFDDIKKMGLRTLFADTFEVLQPLVGMFQDWMLGDGLAKLEEWGEGMGNFTRNMIAFFSDSKNFDLSDLTGRFRDFMRGVDWQKASDDLVAGINSIDWVAVGAEIRTSAANIWKGIKAAGKKLIGRLLVNRWELRCRVLWLACMVMSIGRHFKKTSTTALHPCSVTELQPPSSK
jgi:tape measure domain-containing protein